ncbi:DUF4189 domain-containing protein [Mycolicibacterium sp. 120270]|uniref:DUF4189 domain-containing protein n=1 Tax=Mycolicibacterium sp. 120270 TaxID=3090600 RepID=UPI00299E8759|nr:DUF4189 domain-containing protein [Mycolicibacterium sp. 120270]MDX1885031.1 DUF4189 domain-containing protein [Mycolicibacterium sp. 120270]
MSTNRRLIAATMLAAAAVSSAVATAAPAAAANKYIAVSYSQATGQWGRAQAGNLDGAIAGSLSQCGGHCAVASWSKNGCVALTVNGNRQYAGWYGSTLREAQQGTFARSAPGSWMVWSGCVK